MIVPLLILAAAFLVAVLATGAIVALTRSRASMWLDTADGPQKFHTHSVARVGGVAIFAAILAAALFDAFRTPPFAPGLELKLLLCSLLAFAAGLAEDATKRVGVLLRLSATMVSAVMASVVFDVALDRLDFAGFDAALQFHPAIAIAFTAVAVAGIANAVNIIDGYNGLAPGVSIVILVAIGIVARQVGDPHVMMAALVPAAALLGFLAWNWPGGRIFMGDGGAYLVGFYIGQLSVILVSRHDEVSPWFPLMLVAYPVWETLFSIYRKKFVRGLSPGQPDGLHFHMLVYKRLVRWKPFSKHASDRVRRNSLTAPYLWAVAVGTAAVALAFWDRSGVLAFAGFGFGFLYNWAYRRLVRFRAQRLALRDR